MTIERTTNRHGKTTIRLTECPVCYEPFDKPRKRDRHLQTHDPEDFGLTPLNA